MPLHEIGKFQWKLHSSFCGNYVSRIAASTWIFTEFMRGFQRIFTRVIHADFDRLSRWTQFEFHRNTSEYEGFSISEYLNWNERNSKHWIRALIMKMLKNFSSWSLVLSFLHDKKSFINIQGKSSTSIKNGE